MNMCRSLSYPITDLVHYCVNIVNEMNIENRLVVRKCNCWAL